MAAGPGPLRFCGAASDGRVDVHGTIVAVVRTICSAPCGVHAAAARCDARPAAPAAKTSLYARVAGANGVRSSGICEDVASACGGVIILHAGRCTAGLLILRRPIAYGDGATGIVRGGGRGLCYG